MKQVNFARAFSLFSLSLSLSLFLRPNSSPSLSFTRCAYEMYASQRDKRDKEKENKKMCSRTPQKEVHPNRDDWENEFVRTYHSCELAYFNPSMTVLYICTPLARLNKGANAVVLEVNCFKVCLSAMMKSCVVRVKCGDRSSSRSLRPRWIFGHWRENTSLALLRFLIFFFSSRGRFFLQNKKIEKKRFVVCFCLSLLSFFLSALFLSLFLFREGTKKAQNFEEL